MQQSFRLLAAATIMLLLWQTDLGRLGAEELSEQAAWKALPQYQYGQDMAALLTLDRVVIRAMQTPESQAACAARLAKLLAAGDTSVAAKQYICMQLRQVGTPAQVPLLAKLMTDAAIGDAARQALQAIPGEQSAAALRDGLSTLRGLSLVGVVNSLGERRDTAAVDSLKQLAEAENQQVAEAAIRALGKIADPPAIAFLIERASREEAPLPPVLAAALLRCSLTAERDGKRDTAVTIYKRLSPKGQPAGARRAALEGLLRLQAADTTPTILEWFADQNDTVRRQIAAAHLQSLPGERLDQLLENLTGLPDAGKLAVIELATRRRGKSMLPTLLEMVNSQSLNLRLTGIRCLGMVGEVSTIGRLVDLLASDDESVAAAQTALAHLPREAVTAALLQALEQRPEIRPPVIDVLIELKSYDAIDPLIQIASKPDPETYDPALYGLRGIADPDKTDIPRLVKLLLRTEAGRHRDEVEKTILIVAEKLPPGADRAELVLAALANTPASEAPKYLPVLGRLGGEKSLAKLHQAMAAEDGATRTAAIRALCNWPNADVAEELLQLATDSDNPTYRHWALRAYIRVVTLPNARAESETLEMLKHAMTLAENTEDQRLAVERGSSIRTIDTVRWLAGYLDDPQLAQTACRSLVELAHHRFLRHPNMAEFGPILERIEQISHDAEVVERAKRYRLGL